MGLDHPRIQAIGRHGCLAEIMRDLLIKPKYRLTSAQQTNGSLGRLGIALRHRCIAPSILDDLGIDNCRRAYACSTGQSDHRSHRTEAGGSRLCSLCYPSWCLPRWGSLCLGELSSYFVVQKSEGIRTEHISRRKSRLTVMFCRS